jgi:LmbE family N-acetylglucosaminyl deacetylase
MMTDPLKLMCVLAHPDDESLGTGGILARYAAEGIETHLVTATDGEHGWFGAADDYPGAATLGQRRRDEVCAAAEVLGLEEAAFLGYEDGKLDQADADEAIGKIVAHLRRVRPDVVVTFDPNGSYGHPDHIAICQFTTAATVAAADASYETADNQPPHRAPKLYYLAGTEEILAAYQEAFGELVIQVDGEARRTVSWEPWAITTRVDTTAYWERVWRAIACHRSQLPGYEALMNLPDERRKRLYATQSFYRAYSLVNGGRAVERDLFAGLRE